MGSHTLLNILNGTTNTYCMFSEVSHPCFPLHSFLRCRKPMTANGCLLSVKVDEALLSSPSVERGKLHLLWKEGGGAGFIFLLPG